MVECSFLQVTSDQPPSLILCGSTLAILVTTGLIFLQFMQMKELLYLAIAMMADDLNAAFIESPSL